ncbi:radical SAM protein [Nonomuraea maheshkhaliensis]|uniref:radical SAM protein n=1 Tax=Nonomuraea maheshkhaliensis TaxID=419590 RepID=UPI0031FA1286
MRGRQSWWCLHGSRIAKLPLDAVTTDDLGRRQVSDAVRTTMERGGFFRDRKADTYSLTVLTNTGCNLGCAYCFQNVGAADESNPRPDRIAPARLSPQVITDTLAFTDRMMRAAGFAKLKILLFGGEPLLSSAACVELLRRARPLGLTSAAMVSNGTLLTADLAGELVEAGLKGTQITFDGDQDVHDRIRTTRTGKGTFQQILTNVAAVAAAVDMSWLFRVNVSHRNSDSVPTLLDRLATHVPPAGAGVNIALIDDVGMGYDNRVRYGDDLAGRYVSWYRHALDLGFSVRPPKEAFWCDFCSLMAGRRGAVVNADGRLYSCWETAGKPDLDVGTVRSGYFADEVIEPRWHSCDYAAAPHGTQEARQRFHDTVDAALLDELSARGALR